MHLLDLQNQYCQSCEAGQKLSNLAKEMFQNKRGANTMDQGGDICQGTTSLYNQGAKFTLIANKMGRILLSSREVTRKCIKLLQNSSTSWGSSVPVIK
ncbi:hypothetical protein BTW32_31465 [Bacillus thuringiensis]|nr:hypothetical protein BTW32_31465 [Bacillus thuringiensis]